MSKIKQIDEKVSESELEEVGLTIENIVGTLYLNQELDLQELVKHLDKSEYEPENSPFLVYRPPNFTGTILIPTNGMSSLVGCKSKKDLYQLADHLINTLSEIAPEELPLPSKIEVQNIVIQGDLGTEIELSEVTVLFGMESTEYEPEQFPGVIYRPSDGRTIILFSSGKFMVNGAETYFQAISSVEGMLDKFKQVEIPGINCFDGEIDLGS